MKVRDCLGNSVLPLCIFSFISFILIFVVTYILAIKNNEHMIQLLPLKMSNYQQWGEVPGSLNYTYTKEITLFELDSYL